MGFQPADETQYDPMTGAPMGGADISAPSVQLSDVPAVLASAYTGNTPIGSVPMIPQESAPPLPVTPAPAPPAPAPAPFAEQQIVYPPEEVAMVPKPKGGGAGGGVSPTSKGETAARADVKSAEESELARINRKSELDQRRANIEEADAAIQNQEAENFEARRQKQNTDGLAALDKKRDEIAKMPVRDLFEGRPGATIAAALMSGLGAFSAALVGGPNHAQQAIDSAVARHRQGQLDKIKSAKDDFGYQQEQLKNANLELDAQAAGMYRRFADERVANRKAFGADDAAIENDGLYIGLKRSEAEKEASYQAGLIKRTDELKNSAMQRALQSSQIRENNAQAAAAKAGPTAKPPSADQAKAAGFGERMESNLDAIKAMPPLSTKDRDTIMTDMSADEFYAKNPTAKLAAQTAGKYRTLEEKLSPAGRAYYQSMREFISANLRRESGAAISEGEMRDALSRYGTVKGDKEADRQRKLNAMEVVARSARREAGPAADSMQARGAPQQARGGASQGQIAEAMKWLDGHPDDRAALRWVRQARGLE